MKLDCFWGGLSDWALSRLPGQNSQDVLAKFGKSVSSCFAKQFILVFDESKSKKLVNSRSAIPLRETNCCRVKLRVGQSILRLRESGQGGKNGF